MNGSAHIDELDDPLAPGQSGFLHDMQRRALGALLKALSFALALVALAVYQRGGLTAIFAVVMVLASVTWICLGFFLRGRVQLAAQLLIATILLGSVAGILADGSVRSGASMAMVAGVVAAGTFLRRRYMLAAAGFAVLSLAALNAAESMGWLRTRPLPSGWALWMVQTTVLVGIMVSVFYGRQRTRQAFASQEQALARATQIEADLRASEERFMGLFHSNPAATVVQRLPGGEVIDVNDAFTRMLGLDRTDLLGRPSPNVWAQPSERQAFREVLLRDGRVHNLHAQGVRANGEVFDALVFAELVTKGADQMAITMVLDVSAETSSLRALEQARDRFAKAFNFSPLGMSIARLSDGQMLEMNPANERVLGYTRADLVGRTTLETGLWDSAQDRLDFVQRLKVHGRLEAYETRMRGKHGSLVPVRIWAESIEIEGEPCSLAFTLNVEAEKQREALLINMARGVSGSTGEAFFRSLATHLALALRADMVIAGELDPPDALQALAAWRDGEFLPDVRYGLKGTPCANVFDTPSGLHFVNHLRTDASGLRFPLDDTFDAYLGIALRDADGSPIGVLNAFWREPQVLTPDMQALMTIFGSRCTSELVRLRRDREISKLQASLELRVKARTEQLEYLNRELDSFAYTVSHDLKSPLRAIDGFSHLLREQMDDRMHDTDRDLFDRVDASVQRMNSLITDLLALARVSQGSLQRMDVNLSELAEDVIRQERHRDPVRAVQVKIASGMRANCDARMAHIVLENLLGNAWKYTRDKTDAVIEFGELLRAPGQPHVFYVRDNGAGFDMARSDRLFKPFNRLHASNEFEGSGVGLATVRRILERHGGHIRGEGQVGQGSVFEFSFGNGGVA